MNNIEQEYLKVISKEKTLKAYKEWNSLFLEEKIILDSLKTIDTNILEIGCGAGRISKYLINNCQKYTGIDILPEMISLAKAKMPDSNFLVGDAVEYIFPDNTFEYIFFMHNGIDSIFPYKRRDKLFRNVWNMLKNGGYFIYSTHLLSFVNEQKFIDSEQHKYYCEEYHGESIWMHRATEEEIIDEIEQYNFKICSKYIVKKNNVNEWIYLIVKK